MTQEITLKPSLVTLALRSVIDSGRVPYLWGSPGIAKSSLVAQEADRRRAAVPGYGFIDFRAAMKDATDIGGIPVPDKATSRVSWFLPDCWPTSGDGCIFLDELNRAPVMVQNALLQLVLDRSIGERYKLPAGWSIVAAGNRESDGGGVQRMPAALANRFIHINVTPDVDDWCVWASKAGVEPVVIAFIRYRRDLLDAFDAKAKAFPTPRSWHIVSDTIKTSPHKSIELALYAGTVGYAPALEFMAFLDLYRKLPSIDGIILNPTKAPVPQTSEVSTLWAVCAALARAAKDSNFGRILQYLARIPEEYHVMSVRDAIGRAPELCSTPEFTSWCVAHPGII